MTEASQQPPPDGQPPQAPTNPAHPGMYYQQPYPPGYYPGMPPVQSGLQAEPQSRFLYPGAPATLKAAVLAEMQGTGKVVRGWNWFGLDALLMLFLWFFLSVVVALVFAGKASSEAELGWLLVVAQMVPWIALIGVPFGLAWMLGNGPRIDLGLRWKWSDIGWGVLYGILSLIVAAVIGFITTQIAGEFESSAGEVGQSLQSDKPLLFVFVLLIAFGAPIAEEIGFRGMVFTSLGKLKLWPILTVLITAAIFAGFHFEPVRFFLLFGVGTVLGCARWHTGSLTTSIIAHMCNNLPGALYLLFM